MSYPKSLHSFERSELRVLQNTYPDNEDFLNVLADMVAKLTKDRDEAKTAKGQAEHALRCILQGEDAEEFSHLV